MASGSQQTCRPRGDEALLAAVGILSHDGPYQQHLRDAIRITWLPQLSAASMEGLFVVRGLGASVQIQQETRVHDDMLILDAAKAKLGPGAGPLASMLGWLKCAISRWPAARLIGKSEDDVWLHAHGVAAELRAALALRPTSDYKSTDLYWGSFETYHWAEGAHGARMWKWWPTRDARNCSDLRYDAARPLWEGNLHPLHAVGPFGFAKGPLFLLSRTLARRIVHSPALLREANESITAGSQRAFEDAFAGLAVSVAAARPVRFVHNTAFRVVSEAEGLQLAPSTLVLHMPGGSKSASLIRLVHEWAAAHHCRQLHRPAAASSALCTRNLWGTLCGGAHFEACRQPPPHNCSTDAVEVELPRPQLDAAAATCAAHAASAQNHAGCCGRTVFGGEGECELGVHGSGAWREHSYRACVERCCACSRCRAVSFSRANSDCSWFTACDMRELEVGGIFDGYRSMTVRL
jgi:hypothetical protein